MILRVGTSGWQYRSWVGRFYPPGLPAGRWLAHYAGQFCTVEVNSSFYRLPEASVVRAWAASLPADFVVAAKASRYLTHVRRLRDPAEPVGRLMDRLGHLGPRLGPVLLQLHPGHRLDLEALGATLAAFPPGQRLVLEARHPSWFTEEVYALLEARGAAMCLADRRGPLGPLERTAPWAYLRLHEGRGRPEGCYGRRALASWLERLAGLWGPEEEAFVYFNNDAHACAVSNARELVRLALSQGHTVAGPAA
jgi:uncharacterized protein YecE (DUF72 family)